MAAGWEKGGGEAKACAAWIVHRQNVWEAGQAALADADEATLLRQTHVEEYAQMSEGEAVVALLERCNAIDERDARRGESNAKRATASANAAVAGFTPGAWRQWTH